MFLRFKSRSKARYKRGRPTSLTQAGSRVSPKVLLISYRGLHSRQPLLFWDNHLDIQKFPSKSDVGSYTRQLHQSLAVIREVFVMTTNYSFKAPFSLSRYAYRKQASSRS